MARTMTGASQSMPSNVSSVTLSNGKTVNATPEAAATLNKILGGNNQSITSINVGSSGAIGTTASGGKVSLADIGNGSFAQTYSPSSGITFYNPVDTSDISVTYDVAPSSPGNELANQLNYSKTNPSYTGYYRMDGQNYVVNNGKITLDNNYYRTGGSVSSNTASNVSSINSYSNSSTSSTNTGSLSTGAYTGNSSTNSSASSISNNLNTSSTSVTSTANNSSLKEVSSLPSSLSSTDRRELQAYVNSSKDGMSSAYYSASNGESYEVRNGKIYQRVDSSTASSSSGVDIQPANRHQGGPVSTSSTTNSTSTSNVSTTNNAVSYSGSSSGSTSNYSNSSSSSSSSGSASSSSTSGSYYGTSGTSAGVTGELSMTDATYATSKAGMKELLSVFQSDIDRTINYLSGSEYTTMINTISRYWVGTDADTFKKQLQNMISQDAQSIKTYKSIVQEALNTVLQDFDKLQTQNANSIGSIS